MNRLNLAKTFGLLALAPMLLSATAAFAQDVPPGSYLESCTNAHMQGSRLVADCQRTDGSSGRTALDMDHCDSGVANLDGRLVCVPGDSHRRGGRPSGPPGSYLATCTNVHTRGNRLEADCLRTDGSSSRTALDLDRCEGGIANMDGRLVCAPDDRRGR